LERASSLVQSACSANFLNSSNLSLVSFNVLISLFISVYKLSIGLSLTNNFTPLPNKGVKTLCCPPASNMVSATTDAPAKLIPDEAT
jgi:hypothetical protein